MPDETRETVSAQDLVEDAWQVNLKQMFDELRTQSVANQSMREKLDSLAFAALNNAVVVANQIAQNNADTANLVNKQAVAHRDVAIASEWNLAGQAAIDAIAASVAEKLSSTISPTLPGPSTSPGVTQPKA